MQQNQSFDEQYQFGSYNAQLATGENLSSNKGKPDVGVGFMYHYASDEGKVQVFAGLSGFHVNQPNMTFNGGDGTLPIYNNLQLLNCEYNELTRIPILPNTLVTLFCDHNNIDSITYLPNNLSWIQCQYNQLKSLGTQLPAAIGYLDCSYNLLTVLPPLPVTSMVTLACPNNLLTELPELPETIGVLDCFANPDLKCLPKLTNIDYLRFDSTAVTCIPNYGNVANSIPPLDSVPLCGLNNPKGCLGYTSIPEINTINFSMYPNPACDYTLLNANEKESDLTLQVFDATGKEWVSTKFNSSYELPVMQLPGGLYFLKISDGEGGVGVRKLVVIR